MDSRVGYNGVRFTGGFRTTIWEGPHGEHGARTYNRAPQRGPGAEPWSGDQLNAFLHYHNLRGQPICPKICFFAKQKFCPTFRFAPLDPPLVSLRLLIDYHHTNVVSRFLNSIFMPSLSIGGGGVMFSSCRSVRACVCVSVCPSICEHLIS